jgi:Uma2 family endonuclease
MAIGVSAPETFAAVAQNDPPAAVESSPLVVPDDGLFELVDGKLVEKNVGSQQIEIAFDLAHAIASSAKPRRLGRALTELVLRIDPARNLHRRPDAAFISDARWASRRRVPDVPVWDMVPDLAIEVVSPNTTADEVQDKRLEYFAAGVRTVWVIYPRQREAHVYTSPTTVTILTAAQELDGGALLPGFRLPLASLFEDEPEAE